MYSEGSCGCLIPILIHPRLISSFPSLPYSLPFPSFSFLLFLSTSFPFLCCSSLPFFFSSSLSFPSLPFSSLLFPTLPFPILCFLPLPFVSSLHMLFPLCLCFCFALHPCSSSPLSSPSSFLLSLLSIFLCTLPVFSPRVRFDLGELTPHNIKQLKLINEVIFPMPYSPQVGKVAQRAIGAQLPLPVPLF